MLLTEKKSHEINTFNHKEPGLLAQLMLNSSFFSLINVEHTPRVFGQILSGSHCIRSQFHRSAQSPGWTQGGLRDPDCHCAEPLRISSLRVTWVPTACQGTHQDPCLPSCQPRIQGFQSARGKSRKARGFSLPVLPRSWQIEMVEEWTEWMK